MPDRSSGLQRLQRLSWPERWRLAALALLLPLVDLQLRRQGLKATQSRLARLRKSAPSRPPTSADHRFAQRLAELAAIAGKRGLYANTCLRQALVVHWWLRRRGLPCDLVIGAQPGHGELDAHAWVELEGVALAQHRELPPELVRFTD